jgi:hypothetical protein
MVQPGDTVALGLAAESLWGCREFAIPVEAAQRSAEQWKRRVIWVTDGGPVEGAVEIGLRVRMGEQEEEIRTRTGRPPEQIREMLRARFHSLEVESWPGETEESWNGSHRMVNVRMRTTQEEEVQRKYPVRVRERTNESLHSMHGG